MLRLLRTPTLPNTGSTARDHLASERTFLAWLRTGLGFVALGVAVERFSTFELELAPSHPAPAAPAAAGAGADSAAAAAETASPLPAQAPRKISIRPTGTRGKAAAAAAASKPPSNDAASSAAGQHARENEVHLHREQTLVAVLLSAGLGCIAYGSARYFSNLRLMERGLFKPAYHGAAGLSVGVAGLAGGAWWGVVREERARRKGGG